MSAAPSMSGFMADVERRLEKKTKAKALPREARGPKSIGDKPFARAKEEADRMMAKGSWDGATAKHFVAAYALLHERVYAVPPAELTPVVRMIAAGAAHRMLTKDFGGDAGAFAAFLRWVWSREEAVVKKRREDGRDGRRITWRLQFGPSLLTDFRAAVAVTKR